MAAEEKLRVLVYLVGTWVVDNSGGQWCYVPMPTGNSDLYAKFGIGVKLRTMYWNAAESARGIIDGDDLDVKSEMLKADIRIATQLSDADGRNTR